MKSTANTQGRRHVRQRGELRRRGLLPGVPFHFDPLPRQMAHDESLYRSKYRGCLQGGAIGDALGRPAEGRRPETIEARYGVLTDFRPWKGWVGGPLGTVTDDTQLTMVVAQSLLHCGCLDPQDLANRLIAWLPEGRGKGRACTQAIQNLGMGKDWSEAGVASAGNGAAMRAAPVGLAYPLDFRRLREEASLSALVTHADPTAVVSAVSVALAVAYLLHVAPGALDPDQFVEDVVAGVRDLTDPGHPERRPSSDGTPVRLADRLVEVPALRGRPPSEALGYLYNGAFVLESLPAAVWCFLESPENPEAVIVRAVNAGHDADTVASMAGNLAGAYMGDASLPGRWLENLEYRSELVEIADGLLELAGLSDARNGRRGRG